jgi:hypothetical protein|nr:MAG TPA: hypothetical protein [Caudoviricetes sp.]
MTDTVVYGIDPNRGWLLHVIAYDCVKRTRSDFMGFFNTRVEAEIRLEQITSKVKSQHTIVKIVKVRAFEQIEKEN